MRDLIFSLLINIFMNLIFTCITQSDFMHFRSFIHFETFFYNDEVIFQSVFLN